jgi:hypothetical protein
MLGDWAWARPEDNKKSIKAAPHQLQPFEVKRERFTLPAKLASTLP